MFSENSHQYLFRLTFIEMSDFNMSVMLEIVNLHGHFYLPKSLQKTTSPPKVVKWFSAEL